MTILRRLMASGVPSLLASGAIAGTPLLGLLVLDATEYRTWALVATVSTISMSLDLGTQSMAMRLPSTGPADRTSVAGLIPLAVMGPIGATLAFLGIWAVASTTFEDTGFTQTSILLAITLTGIGCGWRSASNVTLALFLALRRFNNAP